MAVGGQVNLPTPGLAGPGGASGNGGDVTVTSTTGTNVTTSGDGAYGILAQSIGGGGGAAGDLSAVKLYILGTANAVKSNSGSGGAVSISENAAVIQTSGAYAPAIFAQSIGGGGGLVDFNVLVGADSTLGVMARGTAGGNGAGGAVTVTLVNSQVVATGKGSAGILAESDGTSSGSIQISLDAKSRVQGGPPDPVLNSGPNADPYNVAAIWVLGGVGNQIKNAGSIQGDSSASGGTAILANSSASNTVVTNTGVIKGDIVLGGSGNIVNNLAGGVISPAATLNLSGGVFNNGGTLHLSGATGGATTLTGNLVQSSTGVLSVDIDPAHGASGLLRVTGTASLAGSVAPVLFSVQKGMTTVLTAANGLTIDPSFKGSSTPVFSFTPVVQGQSLAIITAAQFIQPGVAGSATQQSVASYLQRVWDSGSPGFGPGFAQLAGAGSASGFATALSQISGQEIAGITAARYEASQRFARSVFGCPAFVDDTAVRQQTSCLWVRNTFTQDNRFADASFPGFTWRDATWKVGGQQQINPGWFVGGALGYELGSLNGGAGLTSVNGRSLLGVASVKRELGPWSFTGALDFGFGRYDSARTIPVASALATASLKSFNVGLHWRAAYDIQLNRYYVEPAFEGDVIDLKLQGYTENGAGAFDLKVASSNNVIFSGAPNVKVGARFDLSKSVAVDAYVGAGVRFTTGNTFVTDASFASLPNAVGGFSSTLKNPNVAGKFLAGVEAYTSEHFSMRIEYEGMAARNQFENSGQLRATYRF